MEKGGGMKTNRERERNVDKWGEVPAQMKMDRN